MIEYPSEQLKDMTNQVMKRYMEGTEFEVKDY
ncbi:hypothetical protein M948_20135 [Virgibacillus sp. CM-4]|nr:hypothetical protein M948_20135 [Virgibacillus sp. CM-4]